MIHIEFEIDVVDLEDARNQADGIARRFYRDEPFTLDLAGEQYIPGNTGQWRVKATAWKEDE